MTKNIYCSEPNIITVDDILSIEECDNILNSNIYFKRSMGFSYEKNKSEETEWRTSSTFSDMSGKYNLLRQRAVEISEMYFTNFKIDITHSEVVQLQKYDIGQQYKAHFDYFNHEGLYITDNDRCGSVIFYLNDAFVSGETVFPKLQIKIRPKKGSALFFDYQYNLDINKLTLHAGVPVVMGQKTIATVWLHEKPYDTITHNVVKY